MATESSASLDPRKLLLAILGDVDDDKNYKRCFKAAHREVHEFFWRLRQQQETHLFVEDLLFDTNGNYPHSEQLDELLQEFQLAGVVTRPNPTYKYNDIAISHSSSGEKFKSNLSPEQKSIYDKILIAFRDKLGVRSTEQIGSWHRGA